jgi:hypothetical protein
MSRKHLRLGAVTTAVVAAMFVAIPVSQAAAGTNPEGGDRDAKVNSGTRELLYRPLTPCRIVDTRHGGGGAISNGQTRTYNASSNLINQGASLANCGVPSNATGITANVTITGTTGFGNLRVFPASAGVPNASTINWTGSGQTFANEVGIGLSANQFKVFGDIGGGGHTNVIFDVTGFYTQQINAVIFTNAVLDNRSNRVVSASKVGTGVYNVTVDTTVTGSGVGCSISVTKFSSGFAEWNWVSANTVQILLRDNAGNLVDFSATLDISC